jgi:hypothetical protein
MFQRRLVVLLASAAAAFGVWKSVPSSQWDRLAFEGVARGFMNPPLFVDGQGTHEAPWQLKGFSAQQRINKLAAPVVVSLGDDLEGLFQSSPASPLDVAVLFRNFQRLGARKAATAVVLSWESPDPIGLAALEKTLGRFDSLVMAAPLSRGAVASPLPPAFRRASIAVADVHGDVALLPVVNRIPIPNVILGDDNTAAGFSVLDSESTDRSHRLLARWDDRVVFSFSLLTVLQRLDLPAEGVEIHLGDYVKLGSAGPVIRIDEFGSLAQPVKELAPYAEIPAEALIDGGEDLFPKQAPDPVILRDDRSAAEPATHGFSRSISGVIATLASDDALTEAISYRRLPATWEIVILGVAAAVMAGFAGVTGFARNMLGLALIGGGIATQWIGFGVFSVWLPGLAILAALLSGWVLAALICRRPARSATVVLPEIFLPSEGSPELALPEKPQSERSE